MVASTFVVALAKFGYGVLARPAPETTEQA
jgi:hypothetical protein